VSSEGEGPFRLIVADPPWSFGDALPGKTRGAVKNYACMTLSDIMAYPLPPLAEDCMLLLWRVAAMQQEALLVANAWGFVPKAEIVWEKLTASGKPWFGMGRYVRAAHETCLLATRGKVKVLDRSVRSRFAAKVGRHSEKARRVLCARRASAAQPAMRALCPKVPARLGAVGTGAGRMVIRGQECSPEETRARIELELGVCGPLSAENLARRLEVESVGRLRNALRRLVKRGVLEEHENLFSARQAVIPLGRSAVKP
jgi:N6-adenosine-specific RNA methylase IME4